MERLHKDFFAVWIGSLVAMATYSSHRLIMGKTLKIFSEAMSTTAYVFGMPSGPLHNSFQSSSWGQNWPHQEYNWKNFKNLL